MGFFLSLSFFFFVVIFDYYHLLIYISAWLHLNDMTLLEKPEIEAFLADENEKRNHDLYEGYRHALDPKILLDRLKDRAPSQELEERKQNAQVDQSKSKSSDDNNQRQLTLKKNDTGSCPEAQT